MHTCAEDSINPSKHFNYGFTHILLTLMILNSHFLNYALSCSGF